LVAETVYLWKSF